MYNNEINATTMITHEGTYPNNDLMLNVYNNSFYCSGFMVSNAPTRTYGNVSNNTFYGSAGSTLIYNFNEMVYLNFINHYFIIYDNTTFFHTCLIKLSNISNNIFIASDSDPSVTGFILFNTCNITDNTIIKDNAVIDITSSASSYTNTSGDIQIINNFGCNL